MNEFDLRTFIDNLRATKPPYECPFEDCGRIYKSFSGIQAHLVNFKHNEKSEPKFGSSSSRAVTRDSLTWLQAQKIVDFELEGKPIRINIYEPLEIVSIHDCDLEPEKRSPKELSQKHKEIRPPSSPRSKAPEPTFRILNEFCPDDAPPLPSSYLKFMERPDESEEQVEYDMDEEDYAWLSLINEKRIKSGLPRVSENILEQLMDCFEKESHFQAASVDQQQLFDEDAVCCVCNDGECDNSNAILFCDMCNLAVHQECYGVPYIPEGQWLCRRCQLSPSQAVDCVLCPNRGGAFKQTSDGRWSHVVCALWVPEVQFANTVFLEPIEGFERVPAARWKLSCYVCKQKKNAGACIQCHKPSCYTAFHVTCAQSASLYMRIEPIKDLSPGGSSYTVRKTAFCDAHAPTKDGSGDGDDTNNDRREESKLKMRRARKLLAQRRNSSPLISVPVISRSRLELVAGQLKLAGKQNFLERLVGFWTLKRQSRFGVPLLRRLQISSQTRRPSEKERPQNQKITTQLRYWRRLRQDLEKARLLIELIRKREQKKREIINVGASISEILLMPDRNFFVEVIDQLMIKDDGNVFAKAVTDAEVPGYSKFVKDPMDLGTMRGKAAKGQYLDVDDLHTDFNLMINNCLKFNKKNAFFLKYAQKMKRSGSQILKEAVDNFDRLKSDRSSTSNLMQILPAPATPAGPPIKEEKAKISKKRSRKKQKLDSSNRKGAVKVEETAPSPKANDARALETSDDEDSRPLSALVIDESRREMSGGEETSSQGASPKRPRKKIVEKLKARKAKIVEVKSPKTPKSPRFDPPTPGPSSRASVNSPRTGDVSNKKMAPSTATRSSFRNFRGGDPTSPDVKSESGDEGGSATEKDDTDCDLDHQRRGSDAHRPPDRENKAHFSFQDLDLVWAAPQDYPCPYPAVVVDPLTSYGSAAAVPKPPESILRKQNSPELRYLVMIFGDNNSWRWLERHLVEPLFVDSSLDRRKLAIPCKSSDKKALQKAYDAAVAFRSKTTGEDPQEFSVDRGDASDASSSCE